LPSPCRSSQRGSVKDVPGRFVKHVMRLDINYAKDGAPTESVMPARSKARATRHPFEMVHRNIGLKVGRPSTS
jgi:hypothetical protein